MNVNGGQLQEEPIHVSPTSLLPDLHRAACWQDQHCRHTSILIIHTKHHFRTCPEQTSKERSVRAHHPPNIPQLLVGEQLLSITASSQKKRKLAPFSATEATGSPAQASFDTEAFEAHARESLSSSPRPKSSPSPTSVSNSVAPSPTTSHTTHDDTPPDHSAVRALHRPVLSTEFVGHSDGISEGATPSGAFADIHIDSASSVDMSGSENGGSFSHGRSQGMSDGDKVVPARSASPAKRSAADMEGMEGGQRTDGAANVMLDPQLRSDDNDMEDGLAANGQETWQSANGLSDQGHTTTNTSTTSLESADESVAAGPDAHWRKGSSATSGKTVPSIDDQVLEIKQIFDEHPPDEGSRGFLVATAWLNRVRARSTIDNEGLGASKDLLQGEIGPVDNSSIVPPHGFQTKLADGTNQGVFVALRPGCELGDDFQVLPEIAWGRICEWYGLTKGQLPVTRFAHQTTASETVVHWEFYPPVITIRKVARPGQESPKPASTNSFEALQLKREQASRGQSSPDDAVVLVSSRQEKYNTFLARSKEAAGIPRTTKVSIWKILNKQLRDPGLPSDISSLPPASSQASSPTEASGVQKPRLVLPMADFKTLKSDSDIELIPGKDETSNDKYNGTSTMELYELFEDATILLEPLPGGSANNSSVVAAKSGALRLPGNKLSSANASAPASRDSTPPRGPTTRSRTKRDGRTRGTVGLQNLGNTCYMNSALQCIRSVEELAVYFLSGKYKTEINTVNPLGNNGRMAQSFALLLQNMYGDNTGTSVTPRQFKDTIGSIQSLFAGYGQQDSQELLSFLVDGLHEDLNRILKKPYRENPDADEKILQDPQLIVKLGETFRANHLARNDSVAMDLFSGFYKNTMECPECDKISITFDPYSLLTVQLPVEHTWQHPVTFVPLNGRPVNHDIDIAKSASIRALKEVIAKQHEGVNPDCIWMAEVYNHKIYRVFEDGHSISEASMQANDHIFAFELPDVPTNAPRLVNRTSFTGQGYSLKTREGIDMDSPQADRFAVPVFFRRPASGGREPSVCLHPLYILLTREEAQDYDIITKKVLAVVAQQTSRPFLHEAKSAQPAPRDQLTHHIEEDKDDSAAESSGRVSDRSLSGEDGYVDVSIDNPGTNSARDSSLNGSEAQQSLVPTGFMNHEYVLAPQFSQLFTLNYAKSSEGQYCTGMGGFTTPSPMKSRVKSDERRGSIQSSTSSGSTNVSRASTPVNNEQEAEESDADDDENKPDIVLGGEDPLHLPTPVTATADDSDSDNPSRAPFDRGQARGGRGKPNKFKGSGKKDRKAKVKTYGRKDRRQHRPARRGSLQSTRLQPLTTNFSDRDDDEIYYIRLGEGIVMDWTNDAIDSLFGGDARKTDGLRGHWLSSADGSDQEFVHDPETAERRRKREYRKKHGISLDDCFVETSKREILSADNAWYCSSCKELRQAAKTLEIWTLPDILIVHLKRFGSGGSRFQRDKIDLMVDYPIEGLDMNSRVGLKDEGKEYVYDLFAVDNHYGGLGGGHYTACAKNFYDGQWYDYNDSHVTKTSENKIHSSAAYLLFYRRRSATPLGPQYLQDLVNDFRNPPAPTEASTTVDGDESDSGEERLGGPTPSLRGSSSASLAAGAGTAANGHPLDRAVGLGAGAGSLQMLKTNQTMAASSLNYGGEGNTWGFDGLNDGQDQTYEGPVQMEHSFFGQEDGNDNFSTAPSPDDSTFGEDDNVSDATWPQSEMNGESTLHLEDTGYLQRDSPDDGDSPSAVDIHVDDR